MFDLDSKSTSCPHAHSPVGDVREERVWHNCATSLAEWAMQRLVNRSDRCGKYFATADGVRQCADPSNPEDASDGFLDQARFERHFHATDCEDIVGVYAYSATKVGKWVAIDIDNHNDNADPNVNRTYALHLFAILTGLGFRALMYESNGGGGYHFWVLFTEAIPAETLFRFGQCLVRDHARHGFSNAPETFPTNVGDTQWGHWLRVPGRHHKRGVWPKVWDGAEWVTGSAAVNHVLSLRGDDPVLIPTDAAHFGVAPITGSQSPTAPHDPTAPYALYNARVGIDGVVDLLQHHGWTPGQTRSDGAIGFIRPGKESNEGEGANLLEIDGMPVEWHFLSFSVERQSRFRTWSLGTVSGG